MAVNGGWDLFAYGHYSKYFPLCLAKVYTGLKQLKGKLMIKEYSLFGELSR